MKAIPYPHLSYSNKPLMSNRITRHSIRVLNSFVLSIYSWVLLMLLDRVMPYGINPAQLFWLCFVLCTYIPAHSTNLLADAFLFTVTLLPLGSLQRL